MKYKLIMIICVMTMMLCGTACGEVESPASTLSPTETVVQETEIAPEVTEPPFEMTTVDGLECFRWCNTDIPVALEFPRLSENPVGKRAVWTYADALANLRSNGFEGELSSANIVETIANDLKAVYEEIGYIRFQVADVEYDLLFIRVGDVYYVLDPYRILANSEDMPDGFSGPWHGTRLTTLCDEIAASFSSEDKTAEWCFGTIASDTATFWLDGFEIPTGTGQPKLSDEEIDELLQSDDYAYVAEKITTLADCVNYFNRGDYCFGDGIIRNASETCSAHQTMQRRAGQCASMSSCMNYLLWGDYEEVGYIVLIDHVELYILHNGVYYAVNPAAYTRNEQHEPVGKVAGEYYPETSNSSATDFMYIAQGLARDYFNGYGDERGSNVIYTYSWPYSFVSLPGDPGSYVFPEDANALRWIGPELTTRAVDLETVANDRFVDENEIVMFAADLAPILGEHYKRDHFPYYRGW